jgi:hypothetical protein
MPLVPCIYKHSSAQNVQALYRAADNQWEQLVILPGRTGREIASQERGRLNSPIAATGRGHLTQDDWVIALMDAELPGFAVTASGHFDRDCRVAAPPTSKSCHRQVRQTAEVLGLSSRAGRPAAGTESAMTGKRPAARH